MRTLATTYQELVGDEHDIAIVMAGLPAAISQTLGYRTLTFLNRAQRVELGAVPVFEVEAYYRTAFARCGIAADACTVAEAAAATEGFPYLIQLVGYYLERLSDPNEPVDGELLATAVGYATAELDSKVFRAMLEPLSDTDVAFLRAMARYDGPAKTADLGGLMGVSHGTVQTYRRRLLDSGVVVAPARGELAFAVPALASYLRRGGR